MSKTILQIGLDDGLGQIAEPLPPRMTTSVCGGEMLRLIGDPSATLPTKLKIHANDGKSLAEALGK